MTICQKPKTPMFRQPLLVHLKMSAVVLISILSMACTCLPKGNADMDAGMKEQGIASWYGKEFEGYVTASGEVYDQYQLTGAHRTLPLGTIIRVTNIENGHHVKVRINDRGPYVGGRIVDLSRAAAGKLGMEREGTSAIFLEVVGEPIPLHDGSRHGAEGGAVDFPSEQAWWKLSEAVPPKEAAIQNVRVRSMFPNEVLRARRIRLAEPIFEERPA